LSELSKNKGNIETRGNAENTAPSIDLEPILKQIVNDTFQALRDVIKVNEKYDGKHVLVSVKNVMVDKTLGAVKNFTLPKVQEKTPTVPQENIPKQNLDKPPVVNTVIHQEDIHTPKYHHKVENDTHNHPQHDQNNENIPNDNVPKEIHKHTDTDVHHEVHTPKHNQNEAQNLRNDHSQNEIKKENVPQSNFVDDFTSSEEETTVKSNTVVNPQITDLVTNNTTVNPQITDSVTNNNKTDDSLDSIPVNNNIPPTKLNDFLDESDEKDDLKKDTTKVETPKVESPKVETPKKIEIKTNDLDSLEDSFDKPEKKS